MIGDDSAVTDFIGQQFTRRDGQLVVRRKAPQGARRGQWDQRVGVVGGKLVDGFRVVNVEVDRDGFSVLERTDISNRVRRIHEQRIARRIACSAISLARLIETIKANDQIAELLHLIEDTQVGIGDLIGQPRAARAVCQGFVGVDPQDIQGSHVDNQLIGRPHADRDHPIVVPFGSHEEVESRSTAGLIGRRRAPGTEKGPSRNIRIDGPRGASRVRGEQLRSSRQDLRLLRADVQQQQSRPRLPGILAEPHGRLDGPDGVLEYPVAAQRPGTRGVCTGCDVKSGQVAESADQLLTGRVRCHVTAVDQEISVRVQCRRPIADPIGILMHVRLGQHRVAQLNLSGSAMTDEMYGIQTVISGQDLSHGLDAIHVRVDQHCIDLPQLVRVLNHVLQQLHVVGRGRIDDHQFAATVRMARHR